MLIGAHALIYSSQPERLRAFFRDVLRFPNMDAGHGWLIFTLPPAERRGPPSRERGSRGSLSRRDGIVPDVR